MSSEKNNHERESTNAQDATAQDATAQDATAQDAQRAFPRAKRSRRRARKRLTHLKKRDLFVIERQKLVLQLRATGMHYDEIATHVERAFEKRYPEAYGHNLPRSWGPKFAAKDAARALRYTAEYLREKATDIIELEEQRLDRLILALWPKAMGTPDRWEYRIDAQTGRPFADEHGRPIQFRVSGESPCVRSHAMILRYMERRARLRGLDAPESIHLTGDAQAPQVITIIDGIDVQKLMLAPNDPLAPGTMIQLPEKSSDAESRDSVVLSDEEASAREEDAFRHHSNRIPSRTSLLYRMDRENVT